MRKAGAFDLIRKDNVVAELYGAIQRAVAATQPVLILQETPSPKQASAESKQSDHSGSDRALVDQRTEVVTLSLVLLTIRAAMNTLFPDPCRAASTIQPAYGQGWENLTDRRVENCQGN